jgi:hypothetical protein
MSRTHPRSRLVAQLPLSGVPLSTVYVGIKMIIDGKGEGYLVSVFVGMFAVGIVSPLVLPGAALLQWGSGLWGQGTTLSAASLSETRAGRRPRRVSLRLPTIRRTGWGLAIAALVSVGIAGCGGAGTATKLSAEQHANYQRVTAYTSAITKEIIAPLERQLPSTTIEERVSNLESGLRLVGTAISKLKQLTPPKGFAKAHQEIISSMEAELPASRGVLKAFRTKSVTAVNNAYARLNEATDRTRSSLAEYNAALERCRANNFTC